MRTPSAIPRLLLLLVLLPTCVLAWLGFQAADGFDAADRSRLERDLEAARAVIAKQAALYREGRNREYEYMVGRAGATLAAEAPDTTVADVVERLRRQNVPAISGTLFDASGRAIWPAEFRPDDRSAALSGEPSHETLLTHLRRSAELAFYGDGGLAKATAIWQEARRRFRSPGLQRLADVEAARLRARSAGTDEAAAKELAALRETWGPLEPEPSEIGRPLLLLQLSAARADPEVWRRLLAFAESGKAALVPLTTVERRRLVAPPIERGVQLHPPYRREERGLIYETPVAHGARLAVTISLSQTAGGLSLMLSRAGFQRVVLSVVPAAPGVVPAPTQSFHTADTRQLEIDLPGGAQGVVFYRHREWEEAKSLRRQRRVWLSLGVAGLFLLTLLGLGLTRRAMARERAARRLRDEFIANVTHEVRTPLTSVLLHSEMLAEEKGAAALSEERRRGYAEVVRAQGKRLARLVDDMLDFTALERGTRTIESVPVDLGAAAREAIAPFLVLAEREGAEARCDVEGEEVAAMGDPAALARVLANLVGNAWKHGRPSRTGGPGRICVRAFEAEGRPTVEVRDDGPGIPPAERATIFRRFGRGRAARRTEGAGIGLSLSRDLARAMGGDLQVSDEQGETVFRLRLAPVADVEV